VAKLRKHPLSEPRFLEEPKQIWCGVFTAIGLLIMGATSYGFLKDPSPFLQFFLSIGVTFILGASASSVMNSWKTQSTTANEIVHSDEEESFVGNTPPTLEQSEFVERTPRPRDYGNLGID